MVEFYKELVRLRDNVLRRGTLVEESIQDSIKSLVERKSEIARKVIKRDRKINDLGVSIDEECIRLLAFGQPKARGLRFIAKTLKITTDIERTGDLSVNIARRAIGLNEETPIETLYRYSAYG